MSETVVAKRYANALFQLAEEKSTLEAYENDLAVVKEVFNKNEQLNTFLEHPSVNNKKKQQVLEKAFNGLHVDVLNTLKLLLERGRIGIIPSVADDFSQLVNDKKGIAEAKVYSVRELSEQEQDRLKQTFAKRFNKKDIHLINIVDPEILGGIKVQVGNTIFDGSVKRKLKRMERDIITANN